MGYDCSQNILRKIKKSRCYRRTFIFVFAYFFWLLASNICACRGDWALGCVPMQFRIWLIFPYFLGFQGLSRFFLLLCGRSGSPIGGGAVGIKPKSVGFTWRLVREHAHKFLYTRYQGSFYLWWIKLVLKLCNDMT